MLDPFAGGDERMAVAMATGRRYVGVELREEAVEVISRRRDVLRAWLPKNEIKPGQAEILLGDSQEAIPKLQGEFDLLFTSPPFLFLERYSDDKRDLSNARDVAEFMTKYRTIIQSAIEKLKPDRFAVWHLQECRDKQGNLANFVGKTVEIFQKAGMVYHAEFVIRRPYGTAALRGSRLFREFRKPGRVHEQLLVFVKGDPKAATKACQNEIFQIPDAACPDII